MVVFHEEAEDAMLEVAVHIEGGCVVQDAPIHAEGETLNAVRDSRQKPVHPHVLLSVPRSLGISESEAKY